MLYNTDPIANQARASRSYASYLGESEVLEVLAYDRRASRSVASTCNMTISAISPQSIPTSTTPLITFSVTVLDCPINSVTIGSFSCTNVVTHNSGTPNFQCNSPSITFPGSYSVTVGFANGQTYRASQQIIYTPSKSSGMTSSSANSRVQYSGSKKRDSASCPFETLFDKTACAVESLTCTSAGPDITLASCAIETSTNVYDLKISFLAAGKPNATQMASLFAAQVNNSAWSLIGLEFLSFIITGSCTSSGCSCNPNYEGSDCSTLASCANNCSSHGECVDGAFGRVCSCDSGFAGSDCSISACPNDCSGQGTCILSASGTTGTCQCDSGFSADDCSIAAGCLNSCSGHGTCSGNVCSCVAPYSGTDCSTLSNQVTQTPTKNLQSTTAFAVVIAIVGFIVLMAVILGVVVVLRNRRRRQ